LNEKMMLWVRALDSLDALPMLVHFNRAFAGRGSLLNYAAILVARALLEKRLHRGLHFLSSPVAELSGSTLVRLCHAHGGSAKNAAIRNKQRRSQ
jgi:hypothetical protein